jgi:hypothetical protein
MTRHGARKFPLIALARGYLVKSCYMLFNACDLTNPNPARSVDSKALTHAHREAAP